MGDNKQDKNPGKRVEAFGAYYFRVDLQAPNGSVMESFPFRSCSGLKSESAVVELEEGGFNTTTRKLIGRTKFPNIVLKQGLCGPTSKLWADGYFAGATPEESYFVKCDESTNSAETRDAGLMLIEVGVAPAIPTEYIIFNVVQKMSEHAVQAE